MCFTRPEGACGVLARPQGPDDGVISGRLHAVDADCTIGVTGQGSRVGESPEDRREKASTTDRGKDAVG